MLEITGVFILIEALYNCFDQKISPDPLLLVTSD